MKVKIINPEFFSRVGYEKDHRYYLDLLYEDDKTKEKVEKFIMDLFCLVEMNYPAHQAALDFYNGIARYNKLQNRRDAAERKIFTYTQEWEKGMTYTVTKKRRVATGYYCAGRYSCDDWIPPYLSDPRYHTIYTLVGGKEIQAENCEEVK